MRQKYYFFRNYQAFMTKYVRLRSDRHRRIRRFLLATLMSGATGSARVTQTFSSNINVWNERISIRHTKGGATQEQLFRTGGWG